ncbi:MAG: aminotransferase class III-fold pyridoxal phosphate-dependent enzyme [Oscillospiraceae bacterium]|nr:aminotransferase class III-fold pyridoxal phosphate-dependent enzyme [Oscillospiraceae bacterium]
MGTKTTKQLDDEYIAHTYARFPVEIAEGKGSLVRDVEGKEYIDMGTGIAVNAFGVSDQAWIDAVTAQLGRFQHTSNLFYSAPCAELAQMLCQATGMKKVFYGNSGAEANECAIKAARKWGEQTKGPGHHTIITLKNSFHGRTITTLAATGQDVFHQQFTPLTEGFVYADTAKPETLAALAAEHNATAIMFEAVQGEGGVLPLPADFVQAMKDVAAKEELLLIADEVQLGNGRSGALYGYMNLGLEPDIVTTAKGLGGGLPIGVCMLGERVADVFTPGDHGSTFGGNPAVCAGAISIFSRLTEDVLAGVRKKSKTIFDMLSAAEGVESVTGMGLMIGVKTKKPVKDVVAACRENGVLVLTAKDKMRLLPALNIPDDLLSEALARIGAACAQA